MMRLYCSACKNEVPEGFSQCIACKSGYVSQLVCASCRQAVPRGSSICLTCDRPALDPRAPVRASTELARPVAPASFSLAVPLPGMLTIPEEYQAGNLGVDAVVQIPPAHAAIMNELSQLAALLHALAAKLILLPGDGSRGLARGMRNLATDIQEEIERRVGPQS